MAIKYLKKAIKTSASEEKETARIVAEILSDIESGGEDAANAYSEKLDNYSGETIVSKKSITQAALQVPEQLKSDLKFAYDRVRGFAEKQLA